jgi:glycosyltransferase involved in cell wall biosynthesis
MRVLFVSDYPHLPDIHGGLQTTTHDLCLAITALGAEAAVLCGTDEHGQTAGAGVRSDTDLGYLVMRERTPRAALALAAAAWGATSIVVQSGTALAPMIAAALATRLPCAVYLHNVETHQLGGALVPHPSLLFLANSRFTAQRWKALCGLDCAVVPPVVSATPYFGVSQGDKVLFVNPVPIKGVELLFQLAALCPELPFLVAESWRTDAVWQRWCRQRAAALPNITWQEPVTDMRPVYAQSRVLLMPSVWEESFGRTVVEAQLAGIPALTSHRGALPEVVGKGGLVLDPHAPAQEWAHALRGMMREPSAWSAKAKHHGLGHVAATPVIVGELLGLLAAHAAH